MTARELLAFLRDLNKDELESPIWVEGHGDQWEVAAVSLTHTKASDLERLPLLLMPAHIALPTVPRMRRGEPGYDPSWWGILGIFRARIRQAARPQILDLMDRMHGRPPGWETTDTENLRAACLIQAAAWATAQAVEGNAQ